jgi:hypothetical protein
MILKVAAFPQEKVASLFLGKGISAITLLCLKPLEMPLP